MHGGVRLQAAVVTIGLLSGCSDPAGAVRKEHATTRKSSPPASPTAAMKPHVPAWWQLPDKTRIANGLRVHTGALLGGRMQVGITDVSTHTKHTIVVTAHPRGAAIGHFTLTNIKITKNAGTGAYGLLFRYRHR